MPPEVCTVCPPVRSNFLMCRGSLHDGRVIEMQSFVPKRSNVSRWSHLDVKRKLCLDVLGQTRLKLNFDRIRHYVFGLRNAFPLSVDHHPGGSGKKKISCAYLLQDVLWDQPRRRDFRITGKSTSDLNLLPKPESQPSMSSVCHPARCVQRCSRPTVMSQTLAIQSRGTKWATSF